MRGLPSLWPVGLVGRVILVLLGAVALEFAASALLYEQAGRLLPSSETLGELSERLVWTERTLAAIPQSARPAAAAALSSDGLRIRWSAEPAGDGAAAGSFELPLTLVRTGLVRLQPELGLRALRLAAGSPGDSRSLRDVQGSLSLPDGSTVAFTVDQLVEQPARLLDAALSAALFAGGILAAAATVVHTLGAPLRRLARVAGRIGHGPAVTMTEDRGPREVREVARALNAMQARIARLVRDRTEALAAVSHDLRTPLARVRLRLEAADDPAARAAAPELAEMEAMIGTVLAFMRGEEDPEPRRPVDLSSILLTLVDAASDAGGLASYAGPDRCRLLGRPIELRRAVGNLIDNALKYGGAAHVSLEEGARLPDGRTAVRLWVEDNGPGLPDEELVRVFEPFHRLDRSRASTLGGVGLGLAIVRRAAERDGGSATLRNRLGGGLCAELLLPLGDEVPRQNQG